ncbi:MAG: alpha/beta hydrolase [Gammaproteobacteria bacterium]|nr:alpha/beta hydrolase [Gammaproteobacteria bacterium]
MINKSYLLSDAMARFVMQSEAFFPADVVKQGLSAQRAAYEAMAQYFSPPRPASLVITDRSINGVLTRRYQPASPQTNQTRILFAHGGGWYLGSLDSHDSFCAQLAHDCGITVIAVDYRLAPEAPYPAGLDDLSAVYQALLVQDPSPLLLVGDSAGGNLVAALTLRCRRNKLVQACGQILIYPALAQPASLPSHQNLADAPLLDRDSLNFCWRNYSENNGDIDPELYPLQAQSLALLPRAAIIAGEYDPLIDDARYYSQQLVQDGVSTQFTVIEGLVHGALRATPTTEAQLLYQTICNTVQQLTDS